jgi:D-alanyl-D-alanine carboxypeptidase
MKRVLEAAAAVLLFLVLAPSSSSSGAGSLETQLQGIIEEFLEENASAPGISACVICPPLGLDWCGAAGLAARGSAEPMTPDHTFRIASNTKTYVAASVLRLVETGRIGLGDPLSMHLTGRYDSLLRSDGYDTDDITVEQVLSHTAGFGDHTEDTLFVRRIFSDTLHVWTPDEQIRCLVEWREPVGQPGERYVYSDAGYVILGTIITGITGRPLGPSVRSLLEFDRLGLESTYWEYMEDPPARAGPRAHQYFGTADVTGWHASFDLYGGGGIVTDTRELALFMRKLLNGEVLERRETLDAMVEGGTEDYRLGLMHIECGGTEALGHQGFWNTFAFYVPSLDAAVSGSILDHEAENGRELMCRLAEALLRAAGSEGD